MAERNHKNRGLSSKDNSTLFFLIIAILSELSFILWHIYMQRVLYKSLWDKEIRDRNPRGAALFYISLMHLLNNLWVTLVLIFSTIPKWLLILRMFNVVIIVLNINNYLKQYTGTNLPDRFVQYIKPK